MSLFTSYRLLGLLNLLTPKAPGSRRVAAGLAYGASSRQRVDLYAPRAGGGPWPLVTFFYGGSWTQGERGYYEYAARALAAAGFLVAVPDCRLVPDVEYPIFLEDCCDAVQWAVAHARDYGGDPRRLAIIGHSAGAYNALMLTLDQRYLAARGLMASLKAVAGLSGPYDFYPFDVAVSLRAFGGVDDPRATQPVNLVRAGLPPIWLAHGSADDLVAPRNTIRLASELRGKGVEVSERHYEGASHSGTVLALGGPGSRKLPVLAELTGFLSAHLHASETTSILAPAEPAA